MYITQFIKREKPSFYKTTDPQPQNDIKCLTQSFFYKTLDNPRKIIQNREQTRSKQKRNEKRLSMYSTIKNQMLDGFYIDGRSFSRKGRENPYMDRAY